MTLAERYPHEGWTDLDRRIAAATELYTDEELATLYPPRPEPEPAPAPEPVRVAAPQEPRPEDRFIYVIRCGAFVKIGISNNISKRMRSIEGHNPFDLEVIASFPGGFDLERMLHEVFAQYRHRLEWFRLEGELAEWIEGGCPL